MQTLNELLKELGVSKVKLAKYLGVSRQMVYNYLEMKNIDEWPKDKKTKLFILLDIQNFNEIEKIKLTNDYILKVMKMLEDNEKDSMVFSDTTDYDFSDLNKKQQKILVEIIKLLKEKLAEDEDELAYSMCRYLYNFLQVIDDVEELKYILGYFAKSNGFIPVKEFVFEEDKQLTFEGILYQAITLFNNGGASKTKILEAHKRFESDIEQRKEEKLSRTQELNTVKIQALRELGYTEITDKNANEVFEKIAEIQSRKI